MDKPKCCQSKNLNKHFKNISDFLDIISEKNRLRILCILQSGEKCACDIYEPLKLPQNLASHHLKILKEFGIINSRREGRKIIYFTNKKNINKNIDSLNNFLITNI
jgi:ArsR family transcriptional regulator